MEDKELSQRIFVILGDAIARGTTAVEELEVVQSLIQFAIDKAVVANMKKHQEYVERLEEEVGTMYDGNPPDWAESDGWRDRISQLTKGEK